MLLGQKPPLPAQCGNKNTCPVLSGVASAGVVPCVFEGDWRVCFVSPLYHQHSVQLYARCGGAALPLLLAAHLHPRAAGLHVGHRVLSHSLPGGAAVQLSAKAEGAACWGGEDVVSGCSYVFTLWIETFWTSQTEPVFFFWQKWKLMSKLIKREQFRFLLNSLWTGQMFLLCFIHSTFINVMNWGHNFRQSILNVTRETCGANLWKHFH